MRRAVLFTVVVSMLVSASFGSAAATAPGKVMVNVITNDYPDDPNEPDQYLKGNLKELDGGTMKWDIRLYHEGEKIQLEGVKVPKWFKEAWLDQQVTCINFFEEADGSKSAVGAAQIVDSGWVDPTIAGGFPQLFRDSWSVIKFVDGGADGVGDWFRIGRGDLDPSLDPPAPPFTEERALEFCESGEVLADGEEPCWGGPENPTETVIVDGVEYGPWPDEEVCESWRTTDNTRGNWPGGSGFLVDGDIDIRSP